jgi:hypothetical protein
MRKATSAGRRKRQEQDDPEAEAAEADVEVRGEWPLQPAPGFVGRSVCEQRENEAREADDDAEPSRRNVGAAGHEIHGKARENRDHDQRGDHRANPSNAK